MANKKVSQLVSKPSVLVTDLFPIADPTTGQLFKTTISDLGTAIGSGVSSVNGLVGAVVLDTDDIQELASPTNRWFTDTRARAALSAGTGISYDSGTGVITNAVTSGQIATALGYTPANDASVVKLTGDQTIAGTKTFSVGSYHQNGLLLRHNYGTAIPGYTGLSGMPNALRVNIGETLVHYDLIFDGTNAYFYTFPSATGTIALTSDLSSYLPLTGGTLTGDLTLSSGNPRLYFTDTDNNPDYFISNTDGTFTVYDVTNSTSRFTIGTTGNGTFGGNLTVGQIIRSGGTSSQFLKADGSVDSSTYAKRSGLTDGYLPAWSSSLLGGSLTDSFISYASNITYVAGMGLSTLNGLDIEGNYGAGTGGLKIRSYDETTGNAFIDFANTGGRMYLGLNRSTSGGLMTNATAYATVLTTGLGTTNLEFGTNATKRMTIDGTTGAVTLTSALSGTSASFVGGTGGLNFTSSTTITNTASSGFTAIYANGGGIYLGGSASVNHLSIASTGAATFSSSVAVGTDLTVTGVANFNNEVRAGNYAGNSLNYIDGTNVALTARRYRASQSRTNNDLGTVGLDLTNLQPTNNVYSPVISFSSMTSGNVQNCTYAAIWGQKTTDEGSWAAGDLIFGTANPYGVTQRMRITSAGNVLIGTSTLGTATGTEDLLTIGKSGLSNFGINFTNGTATRWGFIYVNSTKTVYGSFNDTTFETGASAGQRMKITGVNGNVEITNGLAIGRAEENNVRLTIRGTTSDSSGYSIINRDTNAADLFVIRNDGYGYLKNSSWAYGSDLRMKENISNVENGMEFVNKLKPKHFDYINGTKDNLGFIAQEIQEILPQAVIETQSGTLALKTDFLVPMLVKAVQELKAELDILKNK